MCAGLRDGGFAGEIVLVGAEPFAPYERPHLSKGYLLGTVSREKLPLRPAIQYPQMGIELVLGRRVRDIALDDHRALLDDGKTVGWDVLCLATGSDARRPPEPGRAVYLRELAQAEGLKRLIDRGDAIDIAGAGFIGCEVAAVARQKGCEVRVREALSQPLLHVLGPELGAFLAEVHVRRGVKLQLGAQAAANTGLAAIGSVPRTDLAIELEVDRGIVVDEFGRTSAPGVFAAGDVTRFFHPLYEARIRVEHFQTAQRQGFAVGRTMAGLRTAYTEVPWFWSDQYDLNIQYVGAGLPWDAIVTRGEFGKPPFTVFYLSGGRLIAAAGVNDHHTVARARRVMEARVEVGRDRLADPSFDLRVALR